MDLVVLIALNPRYGRLAATEGDPESGDYELERPVAIKRAVSFVPFEPT